MKLCRHIFLSALLFAAGILRAATTNDFFAQGLELDRAGHFPEAAAAFEKSARAQPASGTLVNLGLAEWNRGHAGAAMLAWEQAHWLDPFDLRAESNLKFARLVTQLDEPQLKWFEAASTWLPPDAWFWMAGASLSLAAGAVLLPPVFRRKKSGWPPALAALGCCVFLFSLTTNVGVVTRTEIGFVLKKNALLRLTPTREAEAIATVPAGTAARKLRTRGNYYFIRTADAAGWIEREEFGLVCAEPGVSP